jgi:hypothetical protein
MERGRTANRQGGSSGAGLLRNDRCVARSTRGLKLNCCLNYNGLPTDHYMWLTGKAQHALKSYLALENRNIDKLIRYAKKMRVYHTLKMFIEVQL